MVTGRVCKNILGLFSNGIKETLEVKLKLVPVPTSMQKEYVENMERYHSLSQIMPEGFDYSAWSDFLKENPTLGQLAQPAPNTPALHRSSTGGYEPFHQMLTRHSPSQEPPERFLLQALERVLHVSAISGLQSSQQQCVLPSYPVQSRPSTGFASIRPKRNVNSFTAVPG